jgi:threonine/homoserine efflux transporter RhtA
MYTVQVDYSYPSSPNADRLGFGAVGCWSVAIAFDERVALPIAGFETEALAVAHAKSLGIPFGYLWKQKYAN